MSVESGDVAVVDGVATMAKWSANLLTDDGWISASNIPAGTGRANTIGDLVGSYRAYGNDPPVVIGEQFTFTGNTYDGKGISATVRVSQIDLILPIEDQWPYQQYVVHFGNDGDTITIGSAAASDATNPNAYNTEFCYIAVDGAQEPDTGRILVRMVSRLRRYASSKSKGKWMRKRGRFDAFVRYNCYEHDPSQFAGTLDPYDSASTAAIRVYVTEVDGTPLYWLFDECRLGQISEFGADHEGMKPVSGEILWRWNAMKDGSGVGSIVTPGSVTVWPIP